MSKIEFEWYCVRCDSSAVGKVVGKDDFIVCSDCEKPLNAVVSDNEYLKKIKMESGKK